MAENYEQDQHFERIENADLFWQQQGRNYENCTFSACNFQKINLSSLKFFDCCFEHCDLTLIDIKATIFQNVVFKDCKLSGVRFDTCNPFALEMHFFNCKMDHSCFYGVKLNKAVFENCSLKGVDFSSAQLKEVRFKKADLLDAKFDQTNLEKADFSSAFNYAIHPEHSKIKGAVFSMDGLPGLLTTYKIKVVP